MIVHIVENSIQLNHIVNNKSKYLDVLFIAVTPNIFVDLENNGFNVKPINDFINNDDHKMISKKSIDKFEYMCEYLKETKAFKKNSSLDSFTVYFKFILNHIYLLIILIEKINSVNGYILKPINIAGFKSTDLFPLPLINDSDDFVDKLFIEKKPDSSLKNYKYKESFLLSLLAKLSNRILKNKEEVVLTSLFINNNFKEYIKYLKVNHSDFQVLQYRIISKTYFFEVIYAIKNLFIIVYNTLLKNNADYYAVISVPSKLSIHDTATILNKIQKLDIFKFKGIDFYYSIENKLNELISFTKYHDNIYNNLKYLFSQIKNPLLLSFASRDISALMGEISKEEDIKSFLISHGSHTWHEELNINQEHLLLAKGLIASDFYDNIIVQSPLALEFLRNNNIKNKNIILSKPIGWGGTFSKEKEVFSSDKKIVLHAGTSKPTIRPIIYETDFEYIKGIIEIYNSIKSNKDILFLVRFRPNRNISLKTLKQLLPSGDNIQIVTDKTFVYYLKKASILVSYSSTTIEEALNYNIPVVLYGNSFLYSHISTDNKDFVRYVSNKKDIGIVIEELVKKDFTDIDNKYIFKNIDIYNILKTKE